MNKQQLAYHLAELRREREVIDTKMVEAKQCLVSLMNPGELIRFPDYTIVSKRIITTKIVDQLLIPSELLREAPDITQISGLLKKGHTVPGAELESINRIETWRRRGNR
jgi:hypothetical protein